MLSRPVLLFLIALLCLQSLSAQIAEDKALHFAAGAVIGGVGGWVASEISDKNDAWIIAGAVGSSLLAGVIKESIDAGKEDNSWDNGDIAATALGGLTVGVTISIFNGKSKKKKKNNLALNQALMPDIDYLRSEEEMFQPIISPLGEH